MFKKQIMTRHTTQSWEILPSLPNKRKNSDSDSDIENWNISSDESDISENNRKSSII